MRKIEAYRNQPEMLYLILYALWLFNIAMENCIKWSIYTWFTY